MSINEGNNGYEMLFSNIHLTNLSSKSASYSLIQRSATGLRVHVSCAFHLCANMIIYQITYLYPPDQRVWISATMLKTRTGFQIVCPDPIPTYHGNPLFYSIALTCQSADVICVAMSSLKPPFLPRGVNLSYTSEMSSSSQGLSQFPYERSQRYTTVLCVTTFWTTGQHIGDQNFFHAQRELLFSA